MASDVKTTIEKVVFRLFPSATFFDGLAENRRVDVLSLVPRVTAPLSTE